MLNFQQFEVLTFDCYGTLIDWESGIIKAIRSILDNHTIEMSDAEILEQYAEIESGQELGVYIKYREILRNVVRTLGTDLRFSPTEAEIESLAESIQHWEPFPDTIEALQLLKKHYKLAIISNIDNDLFTYSEKKLGVKLDWVVTAEQVKYYKPSLQNFEVAFQEIGISKDKILHIAQSTYHDIIPAKTIGLTTVWVNRRKGKEGYGATIPAQGNPDLEVPDLKTLVSLMKFN